MSGFEIWDLQLRSLVGDYDSEHQALKAVGDAIRLSGESRVQDLALVRVGPRGGLTRIAAGAELAKRASAGHPKKSSAPK